MSMHKSFRNDTSTPPGQVINFEVPLVEELKTMKLYELPRGSLFKCDNGSLLNHLNNPVYLLDHLDGMYSVCYDQNNQIVHFAAWTEVVPVVEFK